MEKKILRLRERERKKQIEIERKRDWISWRNKEAMNSARQLGMDKWQCISLGFHTEYIIKTIDVESFKLLSSLRWMHARHRANVLKYNEEPLGTLSTLNNGWHKTENTCKYTTRKVIAHYTHTHTRNKVLRKTIYSYPNNPYNNYPC